LTIAPITYGVVYLTYLSPKFNSLAQARSPRFTTFFNQVYSLHLAALGVAVLLGCFYLIYLLRSRRVPAESRGLWIAALLVGSIFTMPVIWYVHVWRVAPPGPRGGGAV
jgi:hypothetical protein